MASQINKIKDSKYKKTTKIKVLLMVLYQKKCNDAINRRGEAFFSVKKSLAQGARGDNIVERKKVCQSG
jgi:hypothetical protein